MLMHFTANDPLCLLSLESAEEVSDTSIATAWAGLEYAAPDPAAATMLRGPVAAQRSAPVQVPTNGTYDLIAEIGGL